jgi:ABC-type molybdate transport system permease subunit
MQSILGNNGWIGRWLYEAFRVTLIFTWQGTVIASALVSLPLSYKAARAAFEDVDHNLDKTGKANGVKDIACAKRGGIPILEIVKSIWLCKRVGNCRAGIEANISILKRPFGRPPVHLEIAYALCMT